MKKLIYIVITLAAVGMTFSSIAAFLFSESNLRLNHIPTNNKQTQINNVMVQARRNCFYVSWLNLWWCY